MTVGACIVQRRSDMQVSKIRKVFIENVDGGKFSLTNLQVDEAMASISCLGCVGTDTRFYVSDVEGCPLGYVLWSQLQHLSCKNFPVSILS